MAVRHATSGDAAKLALVFFEAIREGPSPYTQAQRRAWVSEPPSEQAWRDRLDGLQVFVVEVAGVIAGFMSIQPGGYIDLAFIRPQYQGTGLFRQLYAEVEVWAQSHHEAKLWTHASLMAQPVFQAMGFLAIHHETVERNGQRLSRARMEKLLI